MLFSTIVPHLWVIPHPVPGPQGAHHRVMTADPPQCNLNPLSLTHRYPMQVFISAGPPPLSSTPFFGLTPLHGRWSGPDSKQGRISIERAAAMRRAQSHNNPVDRGQEGRQGSGQINVGRDGKSPKEGRWTEDSSSTATDRHDRGQHDDECSLPTSSTSRLPGKWGCPLIIRAPEQASLHRGSPGECHLTPDRGNAYIQGTVRLGAMIMCHHPIEGRTENTVSPNLGAQDSPLPARA